MSLITAETQRISKLQQPALPQESHTHPPTTPYTKNTGMQLVCELHQGTDLAKSQILLQPG